MPTYEYACAACDTRQEVQQKMTDASLTVCPSCGTPGLRKLFTNVGVVFKGTGFYRNDSRDSGQSSGPSETSSAAKTGTAGSDSSSSSSSTSDSSGSSTTPKAPSTTAPSAPTSTPAAAG